MFIETAIEFMKKYSDRPAVEDYRRSITYGELDHDSSCIYSWLKKQGIGKEDFVLITLSRGVECIVSVLGVIKCGAAFVLLDSGYPADRIEYIRKDTGAKCEISDENYTSIIDTCEPLSGFEVADVHDAAYAVYTSGSTGKPKGVLHEYGNIELSSHYYSSLDESYTDCYTAFVAPFYFVVAVFYIASMFNSVRPLYIVPIEVLRDFRKLTAFIEEKKVFSIYLSPSYLRLYKNPAACLKRINTGSEPANGIYYGENGPAVTNCYSMSESGYSVLKTVLDRSYDVAPVGKPAFDIDVHLIDEDGNRVEGPGKGEICFRNEFFRGYINLPEKTEAALVNGIYHTGDIARRDENGFYYIIGRKDDMFKINGNRVEPAEIESEVKRVTGLNVAVAKGFTEGIRSYICLYYLKSEAEKLGIFKDGNLVIDQKKLADCLPVYMLPTYYVPLDKLPINANGKLVRRLLESPVVSEERTDYVQPEEGAESLVAGLMAESLKLDKVGANDDFYLIGGDSMGAIRFVALAGEYGVNITVSDLFKFRTPRALVTNVDIMASEDEEKLQKEDEAARKKDMHLLQMQSLNAVNCEKNADMPVSKIKLLYKLKEDVDVERLREALDKVFMHHPILLTSFGRNDDGRFCQRYDPSIFTPTKIIEMPEEDFRNNLSTLEGSFSMKEKRLHFRGIYKTSEGVYLLLVFHHILLDGMGVKLIVNNILKAYSSDEPLKRDYYYYILDKESSESEEMKAEAACELARINANGISGTLDPDLPGPDTCPGIRVNTLKRNDGEGNIFYSVASLMALAKTNNAQSGVVYFGYHGRDSVFKNSSAGGFVRYLPICMNINDYSSPAEFMDEARRQSAFFISHSSCFNNGFAIDTPIVNTMIVLYQKDIGTNDSFCDLITESIEVPTDMSAPMDLLSVRLDVDENRDDFPCIFVYSKGYYSENKADRFNSEFQKAITYLKEN